MIELYHFLPPEWLILPVVLAMILSALQLYTFLEMQECRLSKALEGCLVVYAFSLAYYLLSGKGGLAHGTFFMPHGATAFWVIGLTTLAVGAMATIVQPKAEGWQGMLCILVTLPTFEALPYPMYTVLMLVSISGLLIRSIFLVRRETRARKTRIDHFSMKESVDSLPIAILFADEKGNILLENDKIQELMHQICHREHVDAKKFWRSLERKKQGEENVYSDTKGNLWKFERSTLQLKEKKVQQITAVDITEQEKMNRQLRIYQEELIAQQEAIQVSIENALLLRKEKARNDTWHHVHDVLGQRISILQRSLQSEVAMTPKEIYAMVESLQAEIRDITLESPDETLSGIVDAYRGLHVEIVRKGNFPTNEAVAELYVQAIREGISNAVRHGNARTIWICLSESEKYVLEIKNDGTPPEIDFEWGGGLTKLYEYVTALGGTMSILMMPEYHLLLEVPIPKGDVQ